VKPLAGADILRSEAMGVLSDIIIADPSEASAINGAGGSHLRIWPCLDSKGIDTIKLGTLWQIVNKKSPDDMAVATFMNDSILDEKSNQGPWVYLVPESLQTAIAALDEEAQESIAVKWAATEEFTSDRWEPDDVEEYLQDLVAHARKSREAGKSLLLWMSL
jgi:hypothetical protein